MTSLVLTCALSGFLAACAPAPHAAARQAQPEAQPKPIYRCGSPTRSGKPCTRRVRKPGPCWQHAPREVHRA